MSQNQNLSALLELANLYPSPHNGQPIRLQQISDTVFDVYFEKQRGLQATDISFIFSFVSMGVFMEHFTLSAQALGHILTVRLALPKESELTGSGLVKIATCTIAWQTSERSDELIQALRVRQTSRKKYYQAIGQVTAESMTAIAADAGMQLIQLSPAKTKQAIWLNQRAVFDDMFDEPVRQELDHWLRYTQKQKHTMRDGLAYDCMELNGRIMKFIVNHPRVLRLPGLSTVLKKWAIIYLTLPNRNRWVVRVVATRRLPFVF